MQAALFRIWTRVAESTFYDDNRYASKINRNGIDLFKKLSGSDRQKYIKKQQHINERTVKAIL